MVSIPIVIGSPLGMVQVVLFFTSVILGFFVAIPVGVTYENFYFQCPLFAQVVWNNRVIFPQSEFYCQYPLFLSIALCIVYAALMGLFMLLAIYKKPDYSKCKKYVGAFQVSHISFFLDGLYPVLAVINLVTLVMVLACAGLLTTGLQFFCNDLIASLKQEGKQVYSCGEAQRIDWSGITIIGGDIKGVHGGSFFTSYTIATIASWLLVVVWAMQMLLTCIKCCRCSCDIAEEKQQVDKSLVIAQRRSRLNTPSHTPGHMTPIPPMGPPPHMGPMAMGPRGPIPTHMMAHGPMGHPHPQVMMQPPPPKHVALPPKFDDSSV